MKKFCLFVFMLSVLLFRTEPVIIHASGIANIDEFEKLNGDAKYIGSDYYDNYYLDIEKTGFRDSGEKMLNDIANIMFTALRIVGKLTCSLFYFAMDFDITDILGNKLNQIQGLMKKSIFTPLFNLAFAGTALIMIKRLLKRDTAAIFAEIGKVIAIVVVSIAIVNKSDATLSATTNITKGVATDILVNMNSSYGIAGGADYSASAAGVLWVSLIHEPWKSLEFGSTKPTKQDIESFLSATPKSDERKDLIKNYKDEKAFDKSNGGVRIGLILVYIFPFLAKCAIYIFVAVIQIVFQLLAVFLALLAPLVLILAMMPGYETIIPAWLKKILDTQISILVITFMLALMIKIDTEFYNLIPQYGWLVGIVFQTIMSLGLLWYRDKILELLTNVQRGVGNPRMLQMQMRTAGNPYKQIQKMQLDINNAVRGNNVKQISNGNGHSTTTKVSRDNKENKTTVKRPTTTLTSENRQSKNPTKAAPKPTIPQEFTYEAQDYYATDTQYNKIDTSDLNTIWESAVSKEELEHINSIPEKQNESSNSKIKADSKTQETFHSNKQHNKVRPTSSVMQKRKQKMPTEPSIQAPKMNSVERPVTYQQQNTKPTVPDSTDTNRDVVKHSMQGNRSTTPDPTDTNMDVVKHSMQGNRPTTPDSTDTNRDVVKHSMQGNRPTTPDSTDTNRDVAKHFAKGNRPTVPDSTDTNRDVTKHSAKGNRPTVPDSTDTNRDVVKRSTQGNRPTTPVYEISKEQSPILLNGKPIERSNKDALANSNTSSKKRKKINSNAQEKNQRKRLRNHRKNQQN